LLVDRSSIYLTLSLSLSSLYLLLFMYLSLTLYLSYFISFFIIFICLTLFMLSPSFFFFFLYLYSFVYITLSFFSIKSHTHTKTHTHSHTHSHSHSHTHPHAHAQARMEKPSWRQFHQRFFARFFCTIVLFGSFSSYVEALAPKFRKKNECVNVDEIKTWWMNFIWEFTICFSFSSFSLTVKKYDTAVNLSERETFLSEKI
jgi:hypothetical protein